MKRHLERSRWLLPVLLIPVLALGQTDVPQTQRRIRLGADPVNTGAENWSEWRTAEASEFPWTPPRAFWQGFIKTSRAGQKAGIFVAILSPQVQLDRETFNGSAAEGFAEDGATMTDHARMTISNYEADNLIFTSSSGNGLYFTGGRTPTTVSVVHIKLEKERNSSLYPFLVFYLAAPTSAQAGIQSEFERYVEATYIEPLLGSVAGRVTSKTTGVGVGKVTLRILDNRGNQPLTETTAVDGTYRFRNVPGGSYFMTIISAPGFKMPLTPSMIELPGGTDTSGISLALEPEEAPVPVTKTTPKKQRETTPFVAPDLRFGLGYRQRLDEVYGLALNARIGSFVPEASIGFDLWDDGGHSDRDWLASAGLNWFFFSRSSAQVGLGLIWASQWHNAEKATWSLQFPLSAECFLTPQLSVQASVGPYLTTGDGSTRWKIGPVNLMHSLGFTWYLN